jgi:hypothetical protein
MSGVTLATRARPKVGIACLVAILAVSAGVLPASANASSLLQTVTSNGCAGTPAQTWRIGYRLYFSDDVGRTTDRAAIPGLESELQQFSDSVAIDSACALRASIDVFDMEGEAWPSALTQAQPLALTPPPANEAFRAAGDYDATFMRYPESGIEKFSGITSVTSVGSGSSRAEYPWSAFPVDAAGRSYPEDLPQDPWQMLLMHEWMHEIVFFYIPAEQGWPANDVHGGYVQHPYVNEPYFADMLQGKVLESGQPKGLLPQDYAIEGTPAHPRRKSLTVPSRIDGSYKLHYTAPPDFDGTLEITVQNGWSDPNVNPILRLAHVSGASASWTSGDMSTDRRFTVCVSTLSGSPKFRPYRECDQWIVPRCSVPRLTGMTLAKARRKLARANCRLGPVRHRRGGGEIRVRNQFPPPGRHLKPNSFVKVAVGPGQRH